jgi:hypothetical protein
MCPVCFANMLLVAIGATGGGVSLFAARIFLKQKTSRKQRGAKC